MIERQDAAAWWAAPRVAPSRRLLVTAGVVLVLGAVADAVRWPQAEGPGVGARPDPQAPVRATPGVLVAMHLDEPVPEERTVVWTAAFQAAWDALTDEARAAWDLPRLDLGPPGLGPGRPRYGSPRSTQAAQ